nr:twin-arginine translocation signal domain-containing protein [Segetibacter sp.]
MTERRSFIKSSIMGATGVAIGINAKSYASI